LFGLCVYRLLKVLGILQWCLKVSLSIHHVFGFFGAFCFFLTVDVAIFTHDNLARGRKGVLFCERPFVLHR